MAISIVQQANSGFTSGSSNLVTTFAANTTAGNFLSVGYVVNTTGSISSVKIGSNADNWASVVTTTNAAQSDTAAIWSDPGNVGGQKVITAAFSATLNGESEAYEVAGLKTSAATDKTQSNQNGAGSTTAWTSNATATTTNANEFWQGVAITTGGSRTVSGAWTVDVNDGTLIAGNQIVSSTGTATFNGTQLTGAFAAVVATFLPQPPAVTGTASLALGALGMSLTGTFTQPAVSTFPNAAGGNAGGDRTASLWQQARTGEWQPTPGFGALDPAAVPLAGAARPALTGRGYAGPPPEIATGPDIEWVVAEPEAPPEPPPPTPHPAVIKAAGLLREVGATLYEAGRLSTLPAPVKVPKCASVKYSGLQRMACKRDRGHRGMHTDGRLYWP